MSAIPTRQSLRHSMYLGLRRALRYPITNRDPENIGQNLNDVDLFFTVTAGRSGSGYLSTIAGILHDVDARHEPRPTFTSRMRTIQDGRFPGLERDWLLEHKIPRISRTRKPAYLEGSHIFCKGFLEPWLEIAPVPNLIVWHRENRKIAKSLYKINSIPGRTPDGVHYYLSPHDPGVLPILDPDSLNDYQICYWYVLEIERRQAVYPALVEERGGRVLKSGIDRLNTREGFIELTQFLRKRHPDKLELKRFDAMANRPVNTKATQKQQADRELPNDLDSLEAEVRERIDSAAS